MEFLPLHRDFAVEVRGFDLHEGGTPDEIERLRAAWDAHGLLLFRAGRPVSPARQLEIAAWFGPPPPVANGGDGSRVEDYVTVLHNEEAPGRIALPFHSDLTYTDHPIRGICLHALDLPEGETSTTFVSGVSAWRSLPGELKAAVAGRVAEHRLDISLSGLDWPVFVAEHPMVLLHPRHGAPVLFVTEHHAERVIGMDEAEGKALLARLFAHLYAPAARYEHVWRLHDLVMIDNIALQHARTRVADPGRGARALQRVALSETTHDEVVELARAKERERAG